MNTLEHLSLLVNSHQARLKHHDDLNVEFCGFTVKTLDTLKAILEELRSLNARVALLEGRDQ